MNVPSLFLCCLLTSALTVQGGERFIVRVRDGMSPSMVTSSLRLKPVLDMQRKSVSTTQRSLLHDVLRYVTVELPDDASLSLDSLRRMPWVEQVHPNRRIPLHHAAVMESEPIPPPYGLEIIGAPEAWKLATGKGVVVGILDTGLDWDHADLAEHVWMNQQEDRNDNGRFEPWSSTTQRDGVFGDLDGVDNDENGFIDDIIGYDFVDQSVRNLGDDRDRDGIPFDEQGHGTSVGGVVAATNADATAPSISGLAYASTLMVLRAFDATGNAEEDDVAAALLYAALNGAHVVNMSFGDGVDSPLLRAAVEAASAMGCVLVASAGNTGTTSRQYPAGYDDVIAVGATTERDGRAPFSSTGSSVNISAPGQNIPTTRAGGGYRTVNGTSFAAPYVAAAAALLLELHPSWTPDEVEGTLRERSIDLGDKGWDAFFGDGRLQVDAALQAIGPAHVRIATPSNESEIDVRRATAVAVIGTATSTLFDHYELSIGRGIEPVTWVDLGSGPQRIDTTLGSIDATTLQPGPYVIRLAVVMRHGRTLEHRVRVNVVDARLAFTAFEFVPAWKNDRQTVVLTARTDRASQLVVVIRRGDSIIRTVVDDKRFTRTHSIDIDDLPVAQELSAELWAVSDMRDTAHASTTFTVSDQAVPTTGFIARSDMPFVGYVVNDVRDLYGNNGRSLVLNDLSSGTFGAIKTYVASQGTWTPADSLTSVWIPRGMGDANGDGIPEILGHVVGRTALFQASTRGGSPFERILFADTTSGKLQAAAMYDITGDGREELLCLSDSGLVAITFDGSSFVRLGLAVNTTPPAQGNADNRYDEITAAAGDFDGDGRVEVAYADADGDLVIAEWTGAAFRTEYTALHDGQGGSGYVMAHDVDGDGRREVILGVPDSVVANADREYGRQLWTYRMFRSVSSDTYSLAWTERFTGVRYGIGYRNGLDGGDLNGQPGAEIGICIFPRLYVFTWDREAQTMRPMWYRDDVVTPRMFMRDMNGNGIAEIVYGATVAGSGEMTLMHVAEFDTTSRLASPAGIRARITSATSAELTWTAVAGASQYVVYLAREDDPTYRPLDTVATTSVTIVGLQDGLEYRAYVIAEAAEQMQRPSERSSVATIFIPRVSHPVSIQPLSILRSQLRDGASFQVRYARPTVPDQAERAYIFLQRDDGDVVPDQVSVVGQSVVTVTFPPIDDAEVDTVVIAMPAVPVFAPEAGGHTLFSIPVIDDESDLLYLRDLVVEGVSSLRLRFSQAVDASTASIIGNYTLSPLGGVSAVTVIAADEVRVQLDPASPLGARGIAYYLTARNVRSASGAAMTTGAGNTLGFTLTASDLSDIYAYPQPVRLSTDVYVTFANLPDDARVDVVDQRFKVIARITETDGNGGVRWDLRDDGGATVPPGIYFYRVMHAGDEVLGKFVVRR